MRLLKTFPKTYKSWNNNYWSVSNDGFPWNHWEKKTHFSDFRYWSLHPAENQVPYLVQPWVLVSGHPVTSHKSQVTSHKCSLKSGGSKVKRHDQYVEQQARLYLTHSNTASHYTHGSWVQRHFWKFLNRSRDTAGKINIAQSHRTAPET